MKLSRSEQSTCEPRLDRVRAPVAIELEQGGLKLLQDKRRGSDSIAGNKLAKARSIGVEGGMEKLAALAKNKQRPRVAQSVDADNEEEKDVDRRSASLPGASSLPETGALAPAEEARGLAQLRSKRNGNSLANLNKLANPHSVDVEGGMEKLAALAKNRQRLKLDEKEGDRGEEEEKGMVHVPSTIGSKVVDEGEVSIAPATTPSEPKVVSLHAEMLYLEVGDPGEPTGYVHIMSEHELAEQSEHWNSRISFLENALAEKDEQAQREKARADALDAQLMDIRTRIRQARLLRQCGDLKSPRHESVVNLGQADTVRSLRTENKRLKGDLAEAVGLNIETLEKMRRVLASRIDEMDDYLDHRRIDDPLPQTEALLIENERLRRRLDDVLACQLYSESLARVQSIRKSSNDNQQ